MHRHHVLSDRQRSALFDLPTSKADLLRHCILVAVTVVADLVVAVKDDAPDSETNAADRTQAFLEA